MGRRWLRNSPCCRSQLHSIPDIRFSSKSSKKNDIKSFLRWYFELYIALRTRPEEMRTHHRWTLHLLWHLGFWTRLVVTWTSNFFQVPFYMGYSAAYLRESIYKHYKMHSKAFLCIIFSSEWFLRSAKYAIDSVYWVMWCRTPAARKVIDVRICCRANLLTLPIRCDRNCQNSMAPSSGDCNG